MLDLQGSQKYIETFRITMLYVGISSSWIWGHDTVQKVEKKHKVTEFDMPAYRRPQLHRLEILKFDNNY